MAQRTMFIVLDGVYIGVTWQIQLIDLCVVVMRPYVKLLSPLVQVFVGIECDRDSVLCLHAIATTNH